MNEARQDIDISVSSDLLSLLSRERFSILFTTYQLGRVYSLGIAENGEPLVCWRNFGRCMGLARGSRDGSFWMASTHQVWRFEDVALPGVHDQAPERTLVPQVGFTTGYCDLHDIAADGLGRIVLVSTLFSCLAHLSETHSFKPIWRPPFVTSLEPEDRCHLNGLAMREGKPYVASCFGATNAAEGWRPGKDNGGLVVDVMSNEVICSGLAMPHSPRYHNEQLWVCNSGVGQFGVIDQPNGLFMSAAYIPGFIRGASFYEDTAFVGCSRTRRKAFADAPIAKVIGSGEEGESCGIYMVNTKTGSASCCIRLDGEIDEIYDVMVMPNTRSASLVGFKGNDIMNTISLEPG